MTFTGPPPSSSAAADCLTGDSLPLIDLRLLSHSELLSLSLSIRRNKDNNSPIADDDGENDGLVDPKIDRSVFNESAGSRRQTFSRLRLVPRQSPGVAAASSVPPPPPQQVPIEEEDPRVISLLRQLFRGEGWSDLGEKREEESSKVVGVPMEYEGEGARTAGSTRVGVEGRKKRGRNDS